MEGLNMVRMDGELVGLREFRIDDTVGLHRIYGDPVATEHLSFPPRDLEAVHGLVELFIAETDADRRTAYSLAIVERGRDELIGSARLGVESANSGVIGFALRADQWNRGYGAEAARLLLALGFNQLGMYRIWGARSPLNTASGRLMESIGMREEGTIRAHIKKNDVWRDSVSHSILLPEWRELERTRSDWYTVRDMPHPGGRTLP